MIDYTSLVVDGVDIKDHPDYVDAFICAGSYENGKPLSESDLDELNTNRPEIAQGMAFESLLD